MLAGPVIPEGRPVGATFDVDAAAAEAMDARAMVGDSSAWTNLSTFRGHGGKLIFLHGVSDPWFSAQETVRYYERLGSDNTEVPLRRVEPPVPGARHGPLRRRRATVDQFDMLSAVIDWVEGARAGTRDCHGRIDARREPPVVPFPGCALGGSGDAREAANYTCRE